MFFLITQHKNPVTISVQTCTKASVPQECSVSSSESDVLQQLTACSYCQICCLAVEKSMTRGEGVFVDSTCRLKLTSKVSRSSVAALSFWENKGWSVGDLRTSDRFPCGSLIVTLITYWSSVLRTVSQCVEKLMKKVAKGDSVQKLLHANHILYPR